MTSKREPWDAVIVGGGPSGSCTAAYLARAGRRVLLLERERFPREHIGESLLPGVLPYLDALGVREKVEAAGFERKEGQTFVWGRDRAPWSIDFRELDVHPYSYFVERARFDHILLQHAAESGAEVREESAVTRVIFEKGRAVGVSYRDRDGATHDVSARFVLDASGQAALVARGGDLQRPVRGMKNISVWSYWKGAARLTGDARTHILTVSIRDGWVWVIPLGARTSVGIVTTNKASRAARAELGNDRWYEETLRGAEPVWNLLRDAERCAGVSTARDWSYRSRRFSGPGILLAGDAAAFIDPILSTGIHLAMGAAYWAAATIHSSLREPKAEAVFRRFYDDTYATTYRELLTQVRSFYASEVRQDSVYWTSRRILRAGHAVAPSNAFLFITAGLLRNAATAASPADPLAQARSELGAGKVAPWAGDAGDTARTKSRSVSPPLVWRVGPAGSPALVTVRATGLDLEVKRYEPRGPLDRPRDAFFAFELLDAARAPIGMAVFEEAAGPKGAAPRVAPRFVPYPVRAHDPALLSALEASIARAAAACAVTGTWSLRAARRSIRTVLHTAGTLPAGVTVARSSNLRGGGMAEPALTAVYEALDPAAPLARLYLSVEARVPVELADIPVLRTRYLDLWVSPDKTRDGAPARSYAPAAALIDGAARALWEALAPSGSRGEAWVRAEETLEALAPAGSPWKLLACGRLGAAATDGEAG